ncbi:hypothetical protein AJ80_03318 [Polytolypa hystricis UAMH7299]|uniref:Methyltransferase domain-containing protein n=1 Tax=Polytolypa hystricis (strain UAMH7299) TaxID=1447883 RepID=A0A2B7YK20_POLH7|nr:hypothetical protein AJ80_03318 [Polytolypa hystricis UAMH7299]
MNPEALSSWNANASHWDETMGADGNDYFKVIELPSLARLVGVKPGDRALDLATGNGLVARWLAAEGAARVIATDGSPAMVEHAKRRGAEVEVESDAVLSYEVLDVTDKEALEAFIRRETESDGLFDIITMNMATMDISTLEPLAAALPKLLKKNGGRFIATQLHPIFTAGISRLVEYVDSPATGREEFIHSIKMTHYLRVATSKSVFMQQQPTSQLYFHRPLHEIFAPFFRANLVMDALEEPNFDDEYVAAVGDLDMGSWRRWTQIPKILAFRLRVGGGGEI